MLSYELYYEQFDKLLNEILSYELYYEQFDK